MEFTHFDENGNALMAVSYTHLDVYKRQSCRCGIIDPGCEINIIC